MWLIIGLLTCVVGGVAFGMGFSLLRKRQRWLGGTGQTTGHVKPDARTLLYEVAGKTYRLGLPARVGLRAGMAVPVRYALTRPAQARVQSTGGIWLAPAFFMLLGAGLLAYGLSLLF